MPLVVRGELIGVLCIESETPYRFHEEDKNTIELLGASLAIAIQNMQLKAPDDEPAAAAPIKASPAVGDRAQHHHRELTYYKSEEVIMLDGEYLIRSLPARILWKLLQAHKHDGRGFHDRELRLDKSLGRPISRTPRDRLGGCGDGSTKSPTSHRADRPRRFALDLVVRSS